MNPDSDFILPKIVEDEAHLENLLSKPPAFVLDSLRHLKSNLLILGVGGKMGPSLARMAARALQEIQSPYKVIGVSRFSQPGLQKKLTDWGIETQACDLLDTQALKNLPDSQNVIFMAGQKFGTSQNPALTWALNVHLPALVAERFAQARLVVFSSGNVYPLSPLAYGGSRESDPPAPVGEYALTCLGRERIFSYFSQKHQQACAIMRLNYAIDLRYGVLWDIAQRVFQGEAVDVSMGAVNVIWQGSANARALALLEQGQCPPFVLNVTGPETVSVRWLAEQFADYFQRPAKIVGQERETALLSNAAQAQALFGYPQVSLAHLIRWTADWVQKGGPSLNKATQFETRDGSF